MKKSLLSLMAISLIAVGCLSFAEDWIVHDSDEGTITVYSPNGSYGIVIQDKNLGATEVGYGTDAPIESYGNYYQWGNNYGFPSDPNATISTSTTKVDTSSYGPDNPYSSEVFILDSSRSDWSSERNDNLRGGEGDDDTNLGGLTSDNPITNRQGPCPDLYHVPSIGERNELVTIWYNNKYNDDLDIGLFDYRFAREDDLVLQSFSEDLLLPFSAILEGDTGKVAYVKYLLHLWSSSPCDTESCHITGWGVNRYALYVEVDIRSDAGGVRCFKDERVYPSSETSNRLTLNVISGEDIISTEVSFSDTDPLTSEQVSEAISGLSDQIELSDGYHFTWYEDDNCETEFDLDTAVSDGSIASDLTITGKIEPNKYTISFLDENGSEIMSGEFTYDQETTLPANTSTKEGYTFKGWKDSQGNTYEDGATVKNLTTENGAILEFTPIREENPKPSGSSGGSSGGGGRGGSNTTNSQTDNDKANSEKSDEKSDNNSEDNGQLPDGVEVVNYNPDLPAEQQTLSDGLTPEMHRAYKFAYQHGITTMPTILEADMFGPLDRISMAKMLSQYAMNILGKVPDTSIGVPAFPDITPELNEEFGNAVTLAYQLGIMGINIDEFRPFDLVPRSEFGTALSRMLYQTSDGIYEKTDGYYTLHFNKLKEEGIMTLLDPNIEELRGYVMIMLMRSTKK